MANDTDSAWDIGTARRALWKAFLQAPDGDDNAEREVMGEHLQAAHEAGRRARDVEVANLWRMMRNIVVGVEECGMLEGWNAEVIEIDEYLRNCAPEGRHGYPVPVAMCDRCGASGKLLRQCDDGAVQCRNCGLRQWWGAGPVCAPREEVVGEMAKACPQTREEMDNE